MALQKELHRYIQVTGEFDMEPGNNKKHNKWKKHPTTFAGRLQEATCHPDLTMH